MVPVTLPGLGRYCAADGGFPAPDARMVASVKWYDAAKGFGFLAPGGGLPDIFCHLTAVQASRYETLLPGAAVTCEVVDTEKGPQVSRILAVDHPPDWSGGAANGRLRDGFPDRTWQDDGARGAAVDVQGTVEFYDPARSYGFILPDGGGREVFVHMSTLSRSGPDGLLPGQRVSVWAEEVPRGLQATEVDPL